MRPWRWIAAAAALLVGMPAWGQEKLTQDTIQCSIIGFNVGVKAPMTLGSFVKQADGTRSTTGTMADLYGGVPLDFGLNYNYKYQNGWVLSFDADLFFGNDNLKHRYERMSDVFTNDSTPIIVGTNGTDAVVTCYNRGLSAQAGVGKIVFFDQSKNPNSGALFKLSGGPMMQKTVFMLNEVNAPQVDGDYARLYDHRRQGAMLTESVGLWFMSNKLNLVNFYAVFEVSECWTRSTRPYVIDNLMGLSGPDENRYFDLLYSVKLCWMFPLKGKTSFDYYYY